MDLPNFQSNSGVPKFWSDKQTDTQTNRDYNFIHKIYIGIDAMHIEYSFRETKFRQQFEIYYKTLQNSD